MADTFCRILDTTVCDNTLGSDACQAGFTTDANTSFVVRAICTTPNCTGTKLCFNIKASMDGHDIDGSKSFIVPPSSTVTVRDTSGNYPLTYRCIDLFPFITSFVTSDPILAGRQCINTVFFEVLLIISSFT